MVNRIFVGGTGRSGTTVFCDALGRHRELYSIPFETRFIVDPGGLHHLVDALTDRYDPMVSRHALVAFDRLMRKWLVAPEAPPYLGYAATRWFDPASYGRAVDRFCAGLVEHRFMGSDLFVEPRWRLGRPFYRGRRIWARAVGRSFASTWPKAILPVGRYFADRAELVALAAGLVDDLFLGVARHNGMQGWCEKTPSNLFHLEFLHELFPDSAFVHVTRDPREVALSMSRQIWAPNDIRGVCLFLRGMYERWAHIKQAADLAGRRYVEVKLEDFVRSPERVLAEVAERCGLRPSFGALPPLSGERVGYWRERMVPQDLETVEALLGPYLPLMGY